MATSKYFRHFTENKSPEARLYEDILVEAIHIMGHDVYYLPRERYEDRDLLFGENIYSYFDRAYLMEMYVTNTDGFGGDKDFFSKFGLELRDNTTLVCARRTFERYVPESVLGRPREGDLIYVPVMNKIFEIKFIEEESFFYTHGNQHAYVYQMSTEAFRYSHERINTGIPRIDRIEDNTEYLVTITLNPGANNFFIGEIVFQGDSYASATSTANVSNWIPANNTIYLKNVTGTGFSNGLISGVSSGVSRSIANSNFYADSTYYNSSDNELIYDEKPDYINDDEPNPFGAP